jgi:ribonuclease-3
MADVVVIFRTHSDSEASIVSSLLEANGVPSVVSASITHAVFPLSVSDLGEVRISVPEEAAEEARRIIEDHRREMPAGRVVRLPQDPEALQQAIGYRFRDASLLEQALTHTSRANEDGNRATADNESLEFLGDAVLGFLVADLLFRAFPEFSEGQASKTKASFVSTVTLARQAGRIGLGDHLRLGRGEEKTGGRRKPALLADGYEALIAAIYLDGGVAAARGFVQRQYQHLLDEVRERGVVARDHKSALQEHLQALDRTLPEYRLAAAVGPDHQKQFDVEVVVDGETIATGRGTSKKDAEQDAARLALDRLLSRSR